MSGRTLRNLVKFKHINKSIFDEDGDCILIPNEQLDLLRKRKPIFVHRKGLPAIEIHCSNNDTDTGTNTPIFELNDVILVSEFKLNQVDNFQTVQVQTTKSERVYLFKKPHCI